MGRDKARLRLQGRTMLSIVRAVAEETGHRGRVIRRDVVPRCGPLGGILTGLRSTKADAVLFLACDMPLITAALLGKIIRASGAASKAVFSSQAGGVGFPLLLPGKAIQAVQAQISAGRFSLQQFAAILRARKLRAGARTLLNVNTPEEARLASRALPEPLPRASGAARPMGRRD